MKERMYLCIDLKSFYASAECVSRGLDPFHTNLVVADATRTKKTICLAITPAMKAQGIKNRCRVFQIPNTVDYIMAMPRMQHYIDVSAQIYGIYLQYIAKEDIHPYSIDEAFMEVTEYLTLYGMTARELGATIIQKIFETTGIRATCGIGTNLYLAKVALDISAKHAADFIGELNEASYQKTLWNHVPLTDFWRIGPGIAKKLISFGVHTMEGICRLDEDFLYKTFGVDAELLIDHAWGRESTTIADIKNFHPVNHSLTSGQVLSCDYSYEQGKLIVKEMADLLCLDLVDKGLVTSSITMSLLHTLHADSGDYAVASGTAGLMVESSADRVIIPALMKLYEEILPPGHLIHRVNLSCNRVMPEEYHQYSFFEDTGELTKNHKAQQAVLDLQKKYGKNAVLKGMNLSEGAKTMERNAQIGGHRAGYEEEGEPSCCENDLPPVITDAAGLKSAYVNNTGKGAYYV
ncbi:MAG: DNA repair protein [Lachnospiraceae bacterium]|nr:DNA repair protein [Lachnospiraceae bacterium]